MQTFLRLPKQHKLIISGAGFALLVALLLPGGDASAGRSDAGSTQRTSIPVPIAQTADVPDIAPVVIRSAAANQPASVKQETVDIRKPASFQQKNSTDTLKESAQDDIAPAITEPTLHTAAVDTELSLPLVTPGSFVDSLQPGQRYALTLKQELLQETSSLPEEDTPDWQTWPIQRGDNLAKVFNRAGFTAQEVHHVSRAGKDARKLLKMMPGQELRLLKAPDGSFSRLEYDFSETRTLIVEKQQNNYQSSVENKELYSRLNYASGTIESSFWNAGVRAGLTDNQIMSLATIFGWDIDFALDIREGDHFNVIYEENYIDGEFVGYGDIVAAEFSNQGEQFSAILYTDGNYYTPEGRSMRKSFLRAPVSFKYISSNFKPKRFHPVLKRWKAHNGIDYAANAGTPVVAAGDGRVIEASYNKYNGNYVFIQHGDTYTTKYLHFTKRAVKKGQWVKQGQVIGYVGKTGLATAPHLHYEFLVNGKHQNPRTVKLPKALPIDRTEKQKFLALASEYQQKLELNRRIMLAMN